MFKSRDLINYKYNGNFEDNGGKLNKTQCDICGTFIRYEFELENINDKSDVLKIGSECAKKFDETLYKILNKEKKKFLNNQKIKNVLNVLSDLKTLNPGFDYCKLIKYFEDRGGFTPKQILFIYKNTLKFNIKLNFIDFKIKAIRNREKRQIVDSNNDDKEIICKFLTKQQKTRFNLL